jgi:hypothetical protein
MAEQVIDNEGRPQDGFGDGPYMGPESVGVLPGRRSPAWRMQAAGSARLAVAGAAAVGEVRLACGNVRPMPTAAVNGIQIYYADSDGEGPATVLSHRLLLDQSMFGAQVAALAPEYRVITWDQRGHGGTPAPGPFSYWDSARDVLALLDHLGIGRAVLGAACPRAASSACAPRCWRPGGCRGSLDRQRGRHRRRGPPPGI